MLRAGAGGRSQSVVTSSSVQSPEATLTDCRQSLYPTSPCRPSASASRRSFPLASRFISQPLRTSRRRVKYLCWSLPRPIFSRLSSLDVARRQQTRLSKRRRRCRRPPDNRLSDAGWRTVTVLHPLHRATRFRLRKLGDQPAAAPHSDAAIHSTQFARRLGVACVRVCACARARRLA
jgi:hypothetical protein